MRTITSLAIVRSTVLALLFCFIASSAIANEDEEATSTSASTVPGRIIKVATGRQDASLAVFWMQKEGATATVILMTGGGGGIGLVDGKPTVNNFLVRSRDLFYDQGFNVAVVNRASDVGELNYGYRINKEHIGDLKKVVEAVKQVSPLPIWMIGTSRGTVSTTAAAIDFGNEQLAGIVLTSSVTSQNKQGAVPTQKLDRIRIPVLVLHHERDGCNACRSYEVRNIMHGLDNAPFKKQIMVNGGGNPEGGVCTGMHFHGFVGMEREAVAIMADWIRKPVN